MHDVTPTEIVGFWFSAPVRPMHFRKSQEFDKQITDKFLSIYETASRGELNDWSSTAQGALALILTLDQFPRNIFRDDRRSFESDRLARRASKTAIEHGFESQYTVEQRSFLYMPFMHSEDLNEQDYSVVQYEKLGVESSLKFAIAHRDIIERFGRFPHRNEILARASTPREIEFLKQLGSGF